MQDEASKVCDKVVGANEFDKYKQDPKITKKLASEYDFFIAQANIMAQVAGAFGKVLGSRKKMPNPKAGCVVPPKFAMKPLYDKLQKTVRLLAKERPLLHVSVGTEKDDENHIIDNVLAVYNALTHSLPAEANNIKNVYLKYTMSKPVKVG